MPNTYHVTDEREAVGSGAPALNIPKTLTYDVRVIPTPRAKLNFDFGIGQIAGQVYGSGPKAINVKARHQAGFQVSYGF